MLPGFVGVAPFDQQNMTASGLRAGDSIYLAGGDGLAAGYYTLLPARYALLPGAYWIRPASGFTDIRSNRTVGQIDGSMIVAGYRNVAGTSVRDARWSGFLVAPGALARTQASYSDTYANAFFAAAALASGDLAPRLPVDAGQAFVLSASRSLVLSADMNLGAGRGGRGAVVDIDAPSIEVVSQIGAADGFLQLEADALNRLGADSLLLGGIRSFTTDGIEIQSSAGSRVVIANDAAHVLTAPEVIVAAADTLTLAAGSAIEGRGSQSGQTGVIHVDGNGALVRAASGAQVSVRGDQRRSQRRYHRRGRWRGRGGRRIAAAGCDARYDHRRQRGSRRQRDQRRFEPHQPRRCQRRDTGPVVVVRIARADRRRQQSHVQELSSIDFYGTVDLGAVDLPPARRCSRISRWMRRVGRLRHRQ